MAAKSKNQLLQDKLFQKRVSSWNTFSKQQKKEIDSFAADYKAFMAISKTERLAVKNIIRALTAAGFREMNGQKSIKAGDKLYRAIKGKSVIAFVAGKDFSRLAIIGSHVDSPRLDLKPQPLYEDSDLGMLKTHYYGGVKKYQWVDVPLAMHGVIHLSSGKMIEIEVGEKPGDPVFVIPDLEPHLAKDQMERKGNKVVGGEELSVIAGNLPIDDEEIKEKVKFTVLRILNETYGIVEADFTAAEIELVPATRPADVGFDRALVGAYGQDDKICVYASLRALLSHKVPNVTAVALFVDKEEIGSTGDTGSRSFLLKTFADEYARLAGIRITASRLLEVSRAISADVTTAMNPNFKDVNDPQNVSYLGRGVSIEKYGGSGGKYVTNDAHAEYMQYLRALCAKNGVPWQTGELGKVDQGGGGTIGMYLSQYGMDCVDAGPCVLGMHSPFEIASKADLYSSYLLYKAFFRG